MIKILLVDDDAVIVQIYRKKLLEYGYAVDVAQDGLAAMKALHDVKPDLVVLDVMMPKFSGLEVLEFIRSEPRLKNTRVVVFSNYYFSDVDRAAATAKADANLLKSTCSPTRLVAVVSTVLSGITGATPRLAAGAATSPPLTSSTPAAAKTPTPDPEKATEAQAKADMRRDFLRNGPATLATLHQLNEAFIHGKSPQNQAMRLTDFYRKVHFVTAMAGLAGCEQIALLSSVFEALLLELQEKPAGINPSTLQTIANTLDFFRFLFAHEERGPIPLPTQLKALVVDDDPISNRAIALALRRANLHAVGVQDPLTALKTLAADQFDLLLFDVLMPEMDGFQLCEKVRALPGYRKTPVIFVTGHADFQSRTHSVLSGGTDLIAKPVFPIELAVKAVTHLLRSQLPDAWMRS